MPRITILTGVILILLGAAFFVATGMAHFTALIPAIFGVILAVLGFAAGRESIRKHVMHAAVLVGLLGVLAAVGNVARKPDFTSLAVVETAVMGVILIVYVAMCVRSFIAARKARAGK